MCEQESAYYNTEYDQLPVKLQALCNTKLQVYDKQLVDKKLTAITFIKPGLIDPNWNGNDALDASPGADNNI